jgi:hypothetical protein
MQVHNRFFTHSAKNYSAVFQMTVREKKPAGTNEEAAASEHQNSNTLFRRIHVFRRQTNAKAIADSIRSRPRNRWFSILCSLHDFHGDRSTRHSDLVFQQSFAWRRHQVDHARERACASITCWDRKYVCRWLDFRVAHCNHLQY